MRRKVVECRGRSAMWKSNSPSQNSGDMPKSQLRQLQETLACSVPGDAVETLR